MRSVFIEVLIGEEFLVVFLLEMGDVLLHPGELLHLILSNARQQTGPL